MQILPLLRSTSALTIVCLSLALPPAAHAGDTAVTDTAVVARGRYLVVIGGCNDCHTDGYADTQGQTPETQWLTGGHVGWHGPWGTTYPPNLRLRLQDFDEAGWLAYTANLHTRPIMPDFTIRAMLEADRRAIYHYIRSLGPAGTPAPAFLPPDTAPPPPYFELVLPPAAAPTADATQ